MNNFGYIFGAGNSSANATYVPESLKVITVGIVAVTKHIMILQCPLKFTFIAINGKVMIG